MDYIRSQRQEDLYEFETGLVYIVRPNLKKEEKSRVHSGSTDWGSRKDLGCRLAFVSCQYSNDKATGLAQIIWRDSPLVLKIWSPDQQPKHHLEI